MSDASGGVLPGVTVQLINQSGVVAQAVTDDDGRYDFSGVADGTYAVVFTLHALLVAAELALAVGIVVLVVRLGAPWLRRAMKRRPIAGIRILPPTDSAFQSEAWVACFRALYAIARPWWNG